MNLKTVLIVQARMDSKRLPGKTLAKIGEWSLIELVLKRASKATMIDNIVLATSVNPKDDVLEEHVRQKGFQIHRGSEDDVLSRFFEAARIFNPKLVVRITGDCPLISPKLIDLAVKTFIDRNDDYMSISIGETKEKAYPRGFDVEITTFEALNIASKNATKQFEREHVMPYLYTHQDQFSVSYLDPSLEHSRPRYRLCVDTPQDLDVILKIYDYFKNKLIEADFKDIIQFLDDNPHIAKINQTVQQKHFTEVDSNR